MISGYLRFLLQKETTAYGQTVAVRKPARHFGSAGQFDWDGVAGATSGRVTGADAVPTGTRDSLAESGLLNEVLARLPGASSSIVDKTDYSFHFPKRSSRTANQVLDQLCGITATWMRETLSNN